LQTLLGERQSVAEELLFCTSELAVLGPEMLKKKIDPLKARLNGLAARIETAKRVGTGLIGDTDEIVRAVETELRNASKYLDDPSTPAFRGIVAALTNTRVDIDKRTADIEVRVPISFLADPKAGIREGCLVARPLPILSNQTHLEEAVILVKLKCVGQRKGRTPCLSCVRTAA
jgi:hypothetical protein